MNPIDVISSYTTPITSKKALHFNMGNDAVEFVAHSGKNVVSETINLGSVDSGVRCKELSSFINKAKSLGFKSSDLGDFAAGIRNFAAKNGYLRKI